MEVGQGHDYISARRLSPRVGFAWQILSAIDSGEPTTRYGGVKASSCAFPVEDAGSR